jgi:hypothetical protein
MARSRAAHLELVQAEIDFYADLANKRAAAAVGASAGLSTIIKVESSDTEMDSDFLGHSDIKTKRKMALSRDLTRLCRSVLVEWLNQNAELSLSSVELFVYQTIIWQCLMMCRFRTTFELCHSSELLYEIEILWVPYSTSFGFALVPCFTSAGIEFFLVI